jgi:hypothetical protein
MRKEKGCFEISEDSVIEFDGVTLHSCLCHDNFQHPYYSLYFDLYRNFKNGILPFSGSYMEQPAKVIDAIQYLDYLQSVREAEEAEKQNRKNK